MKQKLSISDLYRLKYHLDMQGKTQRAVIIQEYGKDPIYKQDYPISQLKEGELLVKVQGSTINPSDRIFLLGNYFKRPLPTVCGIQGTGVVVEAKGQNLQGWIGKRVSFTSSQGSWCQYAVASPLMTIQLDKEVPLGSAASGIVNPLTVVGMVEHYKELGCKGGIIHTAAASALGRQLNQLCQKQKIPLLNIVRREQQAQILRQEGATNVLITEGQWVAKYKQYIKNGFNCIYDALGGGPITEALVSNLSPKSFYHLYGGLQNKPFVLNSPFVLFTGVTITGFILGGWWVPLNQEAKTRIRSQYSSLLQKELKTRTFKELHFKDIKQALQISVKNANEGKVLLKFE